MCREYSKNKITISVTEFLTGSLNIFKKGTIIKKIFSLQNYNSGTQTFLVAYIMSRAGKKHRILH